MGEEIKRVARTLIHKGTIIEYYVDTMRLPDGKERSEERRVGKEC